VSALDAVPMDSLVRRAELVGKAEEQAALATEQAALAHEAGTEELLSLPVVTLALEQTALLYAGAYARWSQLAEMDDDKLLARSLDTVARTLRTLAEQVHTASDEAAGYVEAVLDEADTS
jgi:hypothetical protein